MKNSTVRFLPINAVLMIGFTMAAAYGATAPLTVTLAASSGTVQSPVAPGSKTNATMLVSVTDPSANPIENLQPQNVSVVTFSGPAASVCGFTATAITQIKPGFYQLDLSLPQLPNCAWTAGDYLAAVLVYVPGSFGGMAPFKLSVKNGPPSI